MKGFGGETCGKVITKKTWNRWEHNIKVGLQ